MATLLPVGAAGCVLLQSPHLFDRFLRSNASLALVTARVVRETRVQYWPAIDFSDAGSIQKIHEKVRVAVYRWVEFGLGVNNSEYSGPGNI